MELKLFNAPEHDLCFAPQGETSQHAWQRMKAMHAPWLIVVDAKGTPTGVMPVESLRHALARGQCVVGALPCRGAAVLPSRSKLTEILHALEAPGIEAVLLADGDLVRTVVIREGSS